MFEYFLFAFSSTGTNSCYWLQRHHSSQYEIWRVFAEQFDSGMGEQIHFLLEMQKSDQAGERNCKILFVKSFFLTSLIQVKNAREKLIEQGIYPPPLSLYFDHESNTLTLSDPDSIAVAALHMIDAEVTKVATFYAEQCIAFVERTIELSEKVQLFSSECQTQL
jgi:hypothetical protein